MFTSQAATGRENRMNWWYLLFFVWEAFWSNFVWCRIQHRFGKCWTLGYTTYII